MTIIFWFRRDLRLHDNHGLHMALRDGAAVVPVFIFDRHILADLEDRSDPRITFIHDEVISMKETLEDQGSTLLIRHGDPLDEIVRIARERQAGAVYANHDYEPYARERDERVRKSLQESGIRFLTFKDQVIFEKDDILKDNGEPYTVFTPYSKRWKASLRDGSFQEFDCLAFRKNYFRSVPMPGITLQEMGFVRSEREFPSREIDPDRLAVYHIFRDFPGLEGTSRLGLHLRFGTISIRHLAGLAAEINETYLNELIWREFYMMILWHFPQVAKASFKPEYDRIRWRNDEKEFKAWCGGNTGFPIVDAGMREMNRTGYMHNRLRMVTASFLTRLLLIDWRWGEAYFAARLLDYEMASNNGGWQWSAGTGCDAAPYFRIFSPDSQTHRFDPDRLYIKKWVPETGTEQYAGTLVDYRAARGRAIETYRKALRGLS